MTRIDIINQFIAARGYKSYFEIGVCDPALCFDLIQCENKVGVDPDPNAKATYCMTSDEYFTHYGGRTHDFYFIDGLHQASQVERDIQYALKYLNPGGVIMLHDCLPVTKHHQTHEWHEGAWNGTTWMAWVKYRSTSPYLTYTINEDWGCGIIEVSQKREEPIFPLPEHLDWEWYQQNVWTRFNIKPEPIL